MLKICDKNHEEICWYQDRLYDQCPICELVSNHEIEIKGLQYRIEDLEKE